MIYAVIGTMPEAVKLLPVVEQIRGRGGRVCTVFTAQHTEMAEGVFSAFGIFPDVRLTPPPESDMAEKLSHLIFELAEFLRKSGAGQRDAVVSLGDTLTAYAAAVTAFLTGVTYFHIEAGLRTGVFNSPYPEEALRRSIAPFATAHFTTTREAAANLLREGALPERIYEVGNTVYDSMARFVSGEYRVENKLIFTLHRRENVNKYVQILEKLAAFAKEKQDTRIVYPVHKSREVRLLSHKILSGSGNIELTEPMPTDLFYRELATSAAVLTDSGGLQEECAEMGVPIIVLRRETERAAELSQGKITLVPSLNAAFSFLAELVKKRPATREIAIRGGASKRIADFLLI
ncbi:MAG: UDP-N-acetylglucosamine 2-epimerase (non-hydrolyzing) [Clostridia bacterium]|nr:UDP-N-acetylglucosamine 2-epimerase (non-hydrolyzing) [Clostridia bacterium]